MNLSSGEILYSSFGKASGQRISFSISFGCIDAPSGCIEPFGAVSGGVDVNADQDDVLLAEDGAMGVYAACSLFQGDVCFFRNKELGIKASVLKVGGDAFCDFVTFSGFIIIRTGPLYNYSTFSVHFRGIEQRKSAVERTLLRIGEVPSGIEPLWQVLQTCA